MILGPGVSTASRERERPENISSPVAALPARPPLPVRQASELPIFLPESRFMAADLTDTICALSSAAGPGCRAIVRLSGPAAVAIIARFFSSPLAPVKRALSRRRTYPSPSDGPRSRRRLRLARCKTSPDRRWSKSMCRAALPGRLADRRVFQRTSAPTAQAGEFTMRAFLAGKLDLTRARKRCWP